jgi:hypothetical protein
VRGFAPPHYSIIPLFHHSIWIYDLNVLEIFYDVSFILRVPFVSSSEIVKWTPGGSPF